MILKRLFPNKVTQTCLFPALQSKSFHYLSPSGLRIENMGRSIQQNFCKVAEKSMKCSRFLFPSGTSKQITLDRFASSQGSWDQKGSYVWFLPVQTRWKDNDQYLHVNNSVYHAMFDSVINVYLIRYIFFVLFSFGQQYPIVVFSPCIL